MTTTDVPDVMTCYQCGKRIYRKPGATVVHLFWNRPPGARTVDPGFSEPGWAHTACAERAGAYGLVHFYRYPWGKPTEEAEP